MPPLPRGTNPYDVGRMRSGRMAHGGGIPDPYAQIGVQNPYEQIGVTNPYGGGGAGTPGAPQSPVSAPGTYQTGLPSGFFGGNPVDAQGIPIRPEFQSFLDPNTGMIQEQYGLGEGGRAIRDVALGTGISPWEQSLLDLQKTEEGVARDRAMKRAGTEGASLLSRLGATSGYDAGALERVGRNVGRTQREALSDVGREGLLDRLGIRRAGLERRDKFLSAFAPLEQEAVIGRTIGERDKETGFNLDRWKEAMRAWASGKESQAISESGKK